MAKEIIMRSLLPALCRAICVIIALFLMSVGIMAQEAGDSDQSYKFNKEELTQMLAPIALYPDALAAQILMASTYPLEVVEADRWRRQNLSLKNTDLDNALQSKSWDPSLKSLCHFPDILKSMSDKLDQTRKLGDAFLGQEKEVMATIQELRSKARAKGNLKTSNEQKVIAGNDSIMIESVNPDVIYVPVYDPAYVYGPWWYPAYPPYYWYYPSGYYGGASVGFGPGIYFGFNAFSWAWFDWPSHRVHVDLDRTRSFNRFRERGNERENVWKHEPQHRKGVAYRDLRTSQSFGSRAPRVTSPASPERRGYPGGRVEQQSARPSQPVPQRGVKQAAPQAPQVRQDPVAVKSAPAIRREGVVAPRSVPVTPQRPVVRDTPFRGVGQGGFERRAAERGSISNRGTEQRQQSGGSSGGQMQQRQSGGQTQQRQSGGGSSGGASRGGGQGGDSHKKQ
jgi:hypothetical protein